MPVAAVTPVLIQGFMPLFRVATAPATTSQAAQMWAQAYANYVLAGGIPEAPARQPMLASRLATAFNPQLGGAGPALFLSALLTFWMGMTVSAQALGVVTTFLPVSINVNSPQSPTATPEQQAAGLAQVIAQLTLGAVWVTIPSVPPVISPLA